MPEQNQPVCADLRRGTQIKIRTCTAGASIHYEHDRPLEWPRRREMNSTCVTYFAFSVLSETTWEHVRSPAEFRGRWARESGPQTGRFAPEENRFRAAAHTR